MKRFISAIALPLGISIIFPVATGILWPFVLFKALGWQVVNRSEAIAEVGLAVWAGWRARSRLPDKPFGTAALAGVVVTVVLRLVNTAALFAVRGPSIAGVVFAFLDGGSQGVGWGTIGGLLVALFHPELRARPALPLVKVKYFPSRMIAEMASETLEHEGIPSGVVEAPGWPLPQGADSLGADLYVDAEDAARAQEIMSALFGDV
jgi:hypothetical protein